MDSTHTGRSVEKFDIVEFPFALSGGRPKRVCVPKCATMDAAQIRFARPWEYQTLVQTYLQTARGGSFVEVGANLGTDTVIACDFFKTCYAFEPSSANRALLQKTIELYGITNVHVFGSAVGDRPGRAAFFLKGGEATGSHSLCVNDPDMTAQEEVEIVTLDSVFPQTVRDVTYLHIDTEGHDIKVLQGARQFIARQANRPVIRMEFQPTTLALHGSSIGDLTAIMDEFQYKVFFMAQNFMTPLSPRSLAEMFSLWQGGKGWIDIYLSPW